MAAWFATAALTLIAALSYGELAAAMPQAGGQYVYLREAFGPLSGFLYGWTLFLVIQTGTIAAVAVAFAKFLGVFVPWVSGGQLLVRQRPVGPHHPATGGPRHRAAVERREHARHPHRRRGAERFHLRQGRRPPGPGGRRIPAGPQSAALARNFHGHFWDGAGWSPHVIRLVGVAMVGSLFSADAWNNVTFTAGEVRNPRRNLPVSLALGVAIVMALYIGANFVYVNVLPLEAIQHAPEDRVATAVMERVLGPAGRQMMAAAIMISTFGCVNGLILAGARVY